jgi:microsomal epoxide hydrolase
MASSAQPFRLQVPDAAIDDLGERLARTRFPDQAPAAPWTYGTDLGYLKELVEHWGSRFDWRAHEARLNAWPQFKVPLHGIDLHYLHVEGRGPAPTPLLLSHGWPGSSRLSRSLRPIRHGSRHRRSFTVVVPRRPDTARRSPGRPRAAQQIADARGPMTGGVLGYAWFAAQGGDWGAFVTCGSAPCAAS